MREETGGLRYIVFAFYANCGNKSTARFCVYFNKTSLRNGNSHYNYAESRVLFRGVSAGFPARDRRKSIVLACARDRDFVSSSSSSSSLRRENRKDASARLRTKYNDEAQNAFESS